MTTALGFNGGLTLALGVKDRAASARWYQDVLGFTPLLASDEMGWTELATPVTGVSIGFSEVEHPHPGGVVPTFGVADIDVARAGLEAREVRFDGPNVVYEGFVKLATFYDPDGHALMLFQELQTANAAQAGS